MRKKDDLNDLDLGAFIVRQEISKSERKSNTRHSKKASELLSSGDPKSNMMGMALESYSIGFRDGLGEAIKICDECLDVETLGHISPSPEK